MNAAVNRLEETRAALHEALAQQDWTAISTLDLQCRQVVEAALSEPRADEAALRLHLEDLIELYRILVTTCQAEQKRIADELTQLNQSKQGAQLYKLFG
jgi:hypothetical protein